MGKGESDGMEGPEESGGKRAPKRFKLQWRLPAAQCRSRKKQRKTPEKMAKRKAPQAKTPEGSNKKRREQMKEYIQRKR